MKLAIIVGTRPEAIKLMPVIHGARRRPESFSTIVIATGQHRDMLSQMLQRFDIVPDIDLHIMRPNQGLDQLTAAVISELCPLMAQLRPDWVVVQGDTISTFAGALSAFYNRIPVAHVEAGLRTDDKYQPFPEEGSRRLTTHIANLHFAPTTSAKDNLLREGIADDRIRVTGNTSIDAVLMSSDRLAPHGRANDGHRQILMTVHRRENHGPPLQHIFAAIRRLAGQNEELEFLYPVHPNPKVHDVAYRQLGGHPRIRLTDPLDYDDFVLAMNKAHLILTDSGGIQEEAPTLDKPVLVLREKTERQEGIAAGTLKLIGTDTDTIVAETQRLLDDAQAYRRMAAAENPFGDGHAAERILDALLTHRRTFPAHTNKTE